MGVLDESTLPNLQEGRPPLAPLVKGENLARED